MTSKSFQLPITFGHAKTTEGVPKTSQEAHLVFHSLNTLVLAIFGSLRQISWVNTGLGGQATITVNVATRPYGKASIETQVD